MTIATIDIPLTWKILDKTSAPQNLVDQCLSEQDYRGIAMSVPGAVNQETGASRELVPPHPWFSWASSSSPATRPSRKMMPTVLDLVR